jgi:autotransporter-associated beta strand protein
MKIFHRHLCLLFPLGGLGAFAPQAEAQQILYEGYPGFPFSFHYWAPPNPASPTNVWLGATWTAFLTQAQGPPPWQFTQVLTPRVIPNGELTTGTDFAHTVFIDSTYAVFRESIRPWNSAPDYDVTSAAYHTVNVNADIFIRGMLLDGKGWNIQDPDATHTITLFSCLPTLLGGDFIGSDTAAVTVYPGSTATISANLLLGGYPLANHWPQPDTFNQWIQMTTDSNLTISGNIGEVPGNGAKILNVTVQNSDSVIHYNWALTLSGNNTFSGGVIFYPGPNPYDPATTPRVNANNDHALGTGPLTLGYNSTYPNQVPGGPLILGNTSGGPVTLANQLIINSIKGTTGGYSNRTSAITDSQNLIYSSVDNLTFAGNFMLNTPQALYVDDKGGVLIFGGEISNGSGTGSFLKNGPGTIALTGAASTYTGATVINGGVVSVTHLANGGQPSSIGAGASRIRKGDSGALVPNFSTSSTTSVTAINVTADTLVPGLIFGSGGTLRYTGTGDTTDRDIGLYPGQVNYSDFFTPVGPIIPVGIDSSGSGPLKFTSSRDVVQIGFLAMSRNLLLTGTNTGDNTFNLALTDSLISVSSHNQITKDGAGSWIVSGNNTYTGVTTVKAGQLQVARAASLYGGAITPANSAKLTVATAATVAFNVGGSGEFTAAHLDTLLAGGGFASGSKLGLDTTNASGGTFTYTSGIGGPIGLVKLGTGTLQLDGTNSYTGDTNVAAGVLVLSVNGTLDDASTVTLPSLDALVLSSGGTDIVGKLIVNGVTQPAGIYTFGTGKLQVGAGEALDAFATWAASKGLDGTPGKESGPNDDPDNDGRSNLAEFAFNGDPLSGSDKGRLYLFTSDGNQAADPSGGKKLALTVAVRGGTPAFTGNPSLTSTKDGITYTIEGSTDLVTFATPVHEVTPILTVTTTPGDGYEFRSFTLDGSDGLPGHGYLRAKVTK